MPKIACDAIAKLCPGSEAGEESQHKRKPNDNRVAAQYSLGSDPDQAKEYAQQRLRQHRSRLNVDHDVILEYQHHLSTRPVYTQGLTLHAGSLDARYVSRYFSTGIRGRNCAEVGLIGQ